MNKTVILLFAALLYFSSCSQIEYDVYGNLQGNVIDVETNLPIEGASVMLTPGGKNAITATDGAFSFTDLDPQQYTVTVQKNGYSTNRKAINVIVSETTQISITMQKME